MQAVDAFTCAVIILQVRFSQNTYSFYPGPQHYNKISVELVGDFTRERVSDVTVDDSMDISWEKNDTGLLKTTSATKTLKLEAATSWKFDFRDQLLFDWIDTVLYSFSTSGSPVKHVAKPAVGTTVEVVTDEITTATVTMTVTQGGA
eukprot:SAG31_NODE_810_length_11919_cov_4.480924_2_plen_147_part_00